MTIYVVVQIGGVWTYHTDEIEGSCPLPSYAEIDGSCAEICYTEETARQIVDCRNRLGL